MSDYEQYTQSIKRFERITKDREKELSLVIHGDSTQEDKDNALQELIEANLLLVISRASKIHKSYSHIQLMDLIAEGNVALIRAAERYDVTRGEGTGFSTLAVRIIDQRLYKYIRQDRLVHVPEPHFKMVSDISKMQEKYGADLTDDMIMKELKISSSLLKRLRTGTHQRTLSLEDMVKHEGEDSAWAETIEDKNSPNPDKEVNLITLRTHLDKYFENLTDKEQMVLREMFYSGKNPTLHQISVVVGVSPERVRQLLAAGLRRLRKSIELEWELNKDTKVDKVIDRTRTIKERYSLYVRRGLNYEEVYDMEQNYLKNLNNDNTEEVEEAEAEKSKERRIKSIIDYFCDKT